jgi:hypothetical protein
MTAARATITRLAHSTFLTTTIVALGIVSLDRAPAFAEPMTISCGFGSSWGSYYDPEACNVDPEGAPEGGQTTAFEWDDYLVRLTLYNPEGFGDISVTDFPMSQEDFEDKLEQNDDYYSYFAAFSTTATTLGSYRCIPMIDPSSDLSGTPCRDFEILADDTLSWERYEFAIDWDWDSQNNGYNGLNGLARVLRDIDTDGDYDEDMCVQAGNDLGDDNYVPCEYSPFPIIISGDTDFSTITAAVVPEPGAIALLGTGVVALWYRKRRPGGASD